MRTTTRLIILLLTNCALVSSGWAQQPGFDPAAILRELDQLEQRHLSKLTADQQQIAKTLAGALANPRSLIDLYAETVFAAQFDGAKKATSEFRRWKNSQEDLFKSEPFQHALGLHVHYLYLTFLRACGEPEEKIHEQLLQHVARVWNAQNACALHNRQTAELLDRPVTHGLLAKQLQIRQKLPGLDEEDKRWEWLPANSDGMLEKTLLPYLRARKSPMLIQIWDKRIEQDAASVKKTGLHDRISRFTQQTLPGMQWQRARDLILLGKDAEGLSIMIAILRQHAALPGFLSYAAELRERLGPKPVATTPAP